MAFIGNSKFFGDSHILWRRHPRGKVREVFFLPINYKPCCHCNNLPLLHSVSKQNRFTIFIFLMVCGDGVTCINGQPGRWLLTRFVGLWKGHALWLTPSMPVPLWFIHAPFCLTHIYTNTPLWRHSKHLHAANLAKEIFLVINEVNSPPCHIL